MSGKGGRERERERTVGWNEWWKWLSPKVLCVYVSIDAPLCACLTAAWCLIYCKNGN